jgi:glycosyltransferase involved in cell wall biosynthesis
MKILHTVEFYAPSVGGAQEVVRQVSEELVRRGHDVAVATTRLRNRKFSTLNGVKIVGFDIAGNEVRGFRGDTKAYQDFLRQGSFDLMMNYAAQQWTTDLAIPLLSELTYPKILAPCGFSGLMDARYSRYFEQAPSFLRQYDALVFHSQGGQDIEFARHHGLSRLIVIPNGASSEEFSDTATDFRAKYGIPHDVPLLITVGSHTGLKGHSLAIESFLKADIGAAVLVVIGNYIGGIGCWPKCRLQAVVARLRSGGRKRVRLLNCSREDVIAAYHAADLFVFASSRECSPLVLFEAMASRTPFVTIGCGNAEEIIRWSEGGVLLPTNKQGDGTVTAKVETMARAIEELIGDEPRRAALADAGHRSWERRFTWQHITDEYERLYRQCASST